MTNCVTHNNNQSYGVSTRKAIDIKDKKGSFKESPSPADRN